MSAIVADAIQFRRERGDVASQRIMIVEDDRDTRERIVTVLGAAGFDIAGAHASGRAAIDALGTDERFDAALVDLGLPGVHGLEVLRVLRTSRPGVASLVLTIFDDPENVLAAVRAGARGYLLKHVEGDALVTAVRDAITGGSPMTPRIARIVLDAWRRDQAAPTRRALVGVEALTSRERDVLKLLASGCTYAEVAASLGIGLGTVQGYVKVVYGKLEITTKAEAAALATRLGLVD